MFSLANKWFDDINDIINDIYFVSQTKNNNIIEYANIPMVFDIETTSFYENNEKRSTMYAWVFGINGKCVRGRTWEEFIQMINYLVNKFDLNINKRFIIYVHNLSFEFQFIRHLFDWFNIFSIEERTPIYAITKKGIEFRCSYLLSGYSLELVGKNLLKYKVNKLKGNLDYSLIRNSKTPLSTKEWDYILNDGLVVMAYIQELLDSYIYIYELPITKTGFVRELCRKECLNEKNVNSYRKLMRNLKLSKESLNQFQRAFMGGFTHANHDYVGKTIHDVESRDFTSSYPYVMLSEKFPMSTPKHYHLKSREDFNKCLNKYACLFDIKFYNIESKIEYEHYISRSKCSYIVDEVLDNGRVVNANELVITLTEIDFKIIEKCYSWSKFQIINFNVMLKDYLPTPFLETILNLYEKKTKLKGVTGKEKEYMNAKENLNSLYGMAVTNPLRENIIYNENNEWCSEIPNTEKILKKYNNGFNRYLYYAWGVWTTAYARFNLWSGIFECENDYIYSDTDSIKFLNYEKHKKYFEEYNKQTQIKLQKALRYRHINLKYLTPKTIKGEIKLLGVWDFDGSYKIFKTLGAKRYMYYDDKLHITISGVSKNSGIEYLKYKYKTIDKIFKNFKNGLLFPSSYKIKENNKTLIKCASGKMCHTYIDYYCSGWLIDYLGNKSYYQEFSSIHLENTSYELSLDSMFIKYLLGYKESELKL